jgi:hypothetical protein
MRSDHEVDTKVILQKILEMGNGTQEQLKSLRKQTRDISHAMEKVVDRVERVHTCAGSMHGTEPMHVPGLQEVSMRPRFSGRTPEESMESGSVPMEGVTNVREVNPDIIMTQAVFNPPNDSGGTTTVPHGDSKNSDIDLAGASECDSSADFGESKTDPVKGPAGSNENTSIAPEWNAPDGNGRPRISTVSTTPPPMLNVTEATPTHLTLPTRPFGNRPASPAPTRGPVTRSRSASRAPQ